MYLKRLEIHGFKSFAHKTVLEFEPGLTAVVGPNGSGKSNVADALRWVMGEQSMKLLRGKKSEDVIFAGSDKKSKLSVADVTLTFDNKDRKLPYEYSEVALTRRYYRNGESEYLINNQKVRLLDVVDALMRSGFGATNYAVIGQGTIDQMVLAGPAEIKNLIEEAAGVKPYYIKREKTWRKLEQTEENLQRVSELMAEIEPRLRSLRRQAKRMEEREAVANELAGLHLQFFGNQFYLLETELGALKQQQDLKDRAIMKMGSEIRSFQATLEKEERQTRSNINFTEELERKINALEARKYKVQEELAEIRGKLRASVVPGKTDAESLNVEKLDYERQLDAMSSKLKDLDKQLSEEQRQFNELKSTVEKFNKKIEDAKNSKIDADQLRRTLEQFESEFSHALETLTFENFNEIKPKLRQLIAGLAEARRNLTVSGPVDLSALLVSKEETQSRLHKLELNMVEHSTLRQTYMDTVESYNAKLNQIKSLMKDDPEKFKSELFAQEERLNASLNEVVGQVSELRENLNKVSRQEKDKKNFLLEEEKKYREISSHLARAKDEFNQVLVEKARLETRLESVTKEAEAALGPKLSEISQHKKAEVPADLVNRIDRLKKQLELAGGVDEATLQEYKETEERFNYLSSQSSDLSKGVQDLKAVIEELDVVIKNQFSEAFDRISGKFSEYFRILFNGGRAQMTLQRSEVKDEESLDGLEEGEDDEYEEETKISMDGVRPKKPKTEISGIEIKATPPGKKLASIAALSGGERALTAIALLCAMLAAYPSPFVVLDEVDAALDEANSIRLGKILGTLAHQTQFITITHNRETMRQAHTLYGVTMTDDGISKIISLKLEQAEKVAPQN
jgi:chromosome segregation protein